MNHHSDFLVVGSGIAGLSFALQVADLGPVTILTKKARADSNTNRAQGGIAAVLGNDDSFELHIQDTLKAGVGLCHTDAVEQIVREGPDSIRMLQDWGVDFTREPEKSYALDLGREGGHARHRIIHSKDHTGMAVEQALLERIRRDPNIQIIENQSAIELITEHHIPHTVKSSGLHCWGVYAVDGKTGEVHIFSAHVTVLATGGAGRTYLHTTNPEIATGDGVAMAFRAGAPVANLEFLQFHPTSLYHPQGDSFLISEAVRGFGGILRTLDGEPFMGKYDKQADLAPRDIVARAIDTEMKRRGDECVYLDVTHLDPDKVRDHFPTIYQRLLALDIDMTRKPIPVVPAAHYACGGVITDLNGKTVIHGLYVTGEAACTGVHGANRLASNSLLEALVFSNRASQNAMQDLRQYRKSGIRIPAIPDWNIEGTFDQEEWVLISHDLREIRRLMWDYVGIVRSSERLKRAWRRVGVISRDIEAFYRKTRVSPQLVELRNISCVALLIIRSAMFREESRGLHYTTDFPERDDRNWLGDTVIWNNSIFLRPLDAPLQQTEPGQLM